MKKHQYKANVIWTGNNGSGKTDYNSYGRDYTIEIKGKPDIQASADPAFCGDLARHNPEDLFLASLSACHMLWYLHLCADHGITVSAYSDSASGEMETDENGSGRFTSVILKPIGTIIDSENKIKATELHQKANEMCFIANSCNFSVHHKTTVNILSKSDPAGTRTQI